ncbi:MAG: SH3 domain-containing protein [Chloroflexi bacterium]|uniref:SH3 domain-containing protein n=1 Tax=Candidatus Chlorohelix allophototropha TaxID=3003348 RepID=A0A8T7LV56_9CHLR|nr:SH3 domain-containing protein [Chloroflexota bacterium]WJW66622.1 SH3 domain-containing protein [Chloroflexota bacterium L227-S17]
MGTEPREFKSLPRNRKCGNCRHFEPAPLWRKGWCRNSLLYPVHANHLVDSNELDCEKGFRSRIYWEPLPLGDTPTPSRPMLNFQGKMARNTPPLQPLGANFKPQEHGTNQNEESEPPEPYTRLPVYRDESGWRSDLRKRLPFTENWSLEKFELSHLALWGAAIFLVLVVIIIFLGSLFNKPAETNPNASITSAVATQNAQSAILAGGSSSVSQNQVTVTASQVKSLTPQAPTLAPRTGKAAGLGGETLNVRTDPNTTSKVLTQLREGDRVIILEGPLDSGGQTWLKVSANGQVGWVSKKYILADA